MYGQHPLTGDELIIRRVKKQRSKLFGCAPGTHQQMGFLPIEVSDQVSTFATDAKKILVNKSYAESINDLNIRGIVVHESLHIGLKHHIRLVVWMKRCGLSKEDAQELWNIGTDYIINGMIKSSENYGKDFTLPDNVLWDDIYSTCGWPAEKVSNDMLRKGWKPKPKRPRPGGDRKGPPKPGGIEDIRKRCGEILVPEELQGDSKEAKEARAKEEQDINNRVAEAAMLEKQIGQG